MEGSPGSTKQSAELEGPSENHCLEVCVQNITQLSQLMSLTLSSGGIAPILNSESVLVNGEKALTLSSF